MDITRRDFLKVTSSGLAAVAVGMAAHRLFWLGGEAMAATRTLNMSMIEAMHEMTDKTLVPVWAFETNGTASVPGTVIFAVEGDDVEINVTNRLTVAHAFSIPGVVDSGAIAPGQTARVAFKAPTAGSYLYFDNLNAPVNRVMGLHGAFIVIPQIPVTPYSKPTSKVGDLFEHLGREAHFPGQPWDPNRSWVWLIACVDPDKNLLAANNPGISPASYTNGYTPRYFMVNGKSGFFASHDERPAGAGFSPGVAPVGHIGQPALIRSMNAGLSTHSMHIHGNHVYFLAENGVVRDNLWLLDSWTLMPLSTIDMLCPFIAPPDIPPNYWSRVNQGTNHENFPLRYPMHCHLEISQSAAGGNYPNGLVTHITITGPASPADEVVLVEKAELRIKGGKVHLEGRASAGSTLDLYAGAPSPEKLIGTATVSFNGRWSFRGRALKAIASRTVSVVSRATGASRENVRFTVR